MSPRKTPRPVTTLADFLGPEIDRQEQAWRKDGDKAGCVTAVIVCSFPTGVRDAADTFEEVLNSLQAYGAAKGIMRTKQFFNETDWEKL